MIIKKYTDKTEAAALAQARKELGEEVTILLSQSVKPKGFFAFLKKPQVEITVAKEEEQSLEAQIKSGISAIDHVRQAAEKKSSAGGKKGSRTGNGKPSKTGPEEKKPSSVNDGKNTEEGTSPADKRMETYTSSKRIRTEIEDETENGQDKREAPNNASVEEKLDSIQNLLEQKLNKNMAAKESAREEAEAAAAEEQSEREEFLKLLHHTLTDNEVSNEYADQLIREVEQTYQSSGHMEMEDVLSHVYQKIILKFGKSEVLTPAEKGAKAVYFIGPTGVGKTTTLAKIASRLILNDKKKVVLFTTDTYRIAATDQLKTYANILDVPFHIIYSTEELAEYYERYKQYDYILIDTAGHSHKNPEQKEQTGDFLKALEGKAQTENYLVLSTTTKYKDLLDIADSYREITSYKLIFTKLDETENYGNLLNIRMHTMAPISYVTNGQNVPDDILEFNAQSTVKSLLGGND